MINQLIDCLQIASDLFNQSTERIFWNLFLASIPLALSFYLFDSSVVRNLFWWSILLLFIAFLPNAPYVLTDAIHIIELSQAEYPSWAVYAVLIPQYMVFIVVGFEAYVISLTRIENYLSDLVEHKYLLIVNTLTHILCTVGIYLGRFERFNSWDFVTQPIHVVLTMTQDLLDVWKLLSMAIAWLTIWLLTELTKLVNRKIGSMTIN